MLFVFRTDFWIFQKSGNIGSVFFLSLLIKIIMKRLEKSLIRRNPYFRIEKQMKTQCFSMRHWKSLKTIVFFNGFRLRTLQKPLVFQCFCRKIIGKHCVFYVWSAKTIFLFNGFRLRTLKNHLFFNVFGHETLKNQWFFNYFQAET